MMQPMPSTAPPPLSTEAADARHPQLDRYDTPQLVAAFVDDQTGAVAAVQAAGPDLARAVDAALPRIAAGGRLIYIGAGTSGRLGVLDCVELNPTFSWPRDRAQALMAGGDSAMYAAVEGAEDDGPQGSADLHRLGPTENDVVLLIAASGATPYVLGALQAARASGALTIAIANNPGSPLAAFAEIGITLETGAEVISGSTRLKAGTAQKIALNTFSSALMPRIRWNCWKMNPKVRRRVSVRKRSGRLVISRPSTNTLPEVGLAMAPMMLSSVVLPDPLGPLKTVTLRASTSRLTSSMAVNSSGRLRLKIFVMCFSSTIIAS